MDFDDHVKRGIAFYGEGNLHSAIESFEVAKGMSKSQQDRAEINNFIEGIQQMLDLEAVEAKSAEEEAIHRAKVLGISDINQIEQAITEYTKTLKNNPNDNSTKNNLASAYYIRGVVFKSEGEHTQAIEAYEKAIKLQPNYPNALDKLGYAYLKTKKYEDAIKTFKELEKFNPDFYKNRNEKLKQNHPDHSNNAGGLVEVYKQRAMQYDNEQKFDLVIKDCEEVLELDPEDTNYRELLEMAKVEVAKGKK